ncbi:mechanosensitive ion channel family protein [Massilia sp. R2A-15]|uniref:mechanosensitive ion channel family protein n=1 Tax=Massilia sp. R2A-15 TaxID=3064278 RepID=UPI002734FF68|nr:mechanosensitive ion channel family protein [Massilia sp. R2A-15]WLI90728.1 mechanosensitive ion channel family protein [Massilia sp. R2A-15]
MNTARITSWMDAAQPILVAFGLKVLGAIAVFVVGRWLIGLVTKLVAAGMSRQRIDPTVQRYLVSFITVALNIILVVAILGYFGVETTSFAALVAGAGVAIGAAWSGLLGNFAAGIFLLVLRPYQVDDYVMIGGIEGTVLELGLFGTTINTPDNVRTIVGNGKIMGSDIKNYSAHPFRRVDLVAQLAGSADVQKAIALLKAALATVANTTATPTADVAILEFNEFGPKLSVRPYCHTSHYWQVYFDTNRMIADTLGAAGFPVATHPVKIYPVEAAARAAPAHLQENIP